MKTEEKLSALMDAELDELNERSLLQALSRDVELRRAWGRFHAIRAAMTRQLDVLAALDLPERVMARLEREVQPAADAALRFWPLAGGFAAAASVAAIAILAVQTLQQPTGAPAGGSPVAVAATGAQVASGAGATLVPVTNDSAERLNLYLFGHNEFMPTGGMGGMLPYVRVVAHEDK